MAIGTMQAGLGPATLECIPRVRSRRERSQTVPTTRTTYHHHHNNNNKPATTTTTTTTTPRNYRTKSPSKSRWRQQLNETTPDSKIQIWIEIPCQSSLVNKMAYAEQQHWVKVQQKTFTKWLNTKIEARNLEVQDLVKDLSDGVCLPAPF